jgi:two-component system, OmpR family, sensor kinase
MTTTTTMTDRRRFRLGFRARVLGFTAALLVGAVVVGLVAQRFVLLERLDAETENLLEQERSEMELLAQGRSPVTGESFGGDVRAVFDIFLARNVPAKGEVFLTFVDGAPYKTTPAPYRLDLQPDLVERWGTLESGERGGLGTPAGPVRYLAVPLLSDDETQGVFVAANFTQDRRAEVDAALAVTALVSVVVLFLATAAGWVVAGRLLRPVRDLTESARSITETDLSQRLPVEGDDEITELTRTYNEMLDRLEAAFAAQRAFVDDAGHELRTPITIVRGHLEVMGDDPDDQRDTVALVTEELDRMARIVNDLLVLAKAERSDFVVRERTELSELTVDIATNARQLGDRRWTLDACAAGPIDVDPQRITQAVLNLVRNAVEHSQAGDDIGLGSAWSADGARIWVRDTGAGIEPAEQDRIFDRFSRGRVGRRRSEGAGLGLAIVRAIATAHHGRVELASAPGVGSTFTIVLPGTAPPEAESTETLLDVRGPSPPIGERADVTSVGATRPADPRDASPSDPTTEMLSPEERTWPGS